MFFRQVFEPHLAQYAYIVGCQRTGEAIVIDPMRDLERFDRIAQEEGLRIVAATETHIHADYLSGAREYAHRGVTVYLSDEGGEGWRYGWSEDEGADIHLVRNGDRFQVGLIEFQVVHSPGHTPEHIAFLVTDRGGGASEPMGMLSGDFVFVGDLGRPDLLESAAGQEGAMRPSAEKLYQSALGFLELPDYLQIWPGHGAGSACGKALGAVPDSTVGYERRFSPALDFVQRGEDEFVEFILEGQPEPPTYFARMKRLNRDGPPLLGEVPQPERLDAAGLRAAMDGGATIIDTRADRAAYMSSHLERSLYAPADKTFPTIVGSYVEPEEDVVLIADESDVEECVLDMIRIGLDRAVGWAPPSLLAELPTVATHQVSTTDVRAEALEGGHLLDVRRATEFAASHVPGATNVAHTRLSARMDELPPEGTLWVHCRSGARAAAAVGYLERQGRSVVYVDGPVDGLPDLVHGTAEIAAT